MKLQKYRIEYTNGMIQEKYLIPNGVDFFLEKSPMAEAMKTGKLVLPEQQGGTHEVKITLLSEQGSKQEEGEPIAFAEWVNNNAYELTSDVWCVRLDKEEKEYSTQEFYQLFKDSTK